MAATNDVIVVMVYVKYIPKPINILDTEGAVDHVAPCRVLENTSPVPVVYCACEAGSTVYGLICTRAVAYSWCTGTHTNVHAVVHVSIDIDRKRARWVTDQYDRQVAWKY